MKLVTYRYEEKEAVGVISPCGNYVYPVKDLGFAYDTMNELIDALSGEGLCGLQKAAEAGTEAEIPFEQVELLAPIPVPKQDMICLGINYMAHAEESARYKKEAFGGERPFAVYFSKRIGEAVKPYGEIEGHLDIVERLDYEAELAFVIGKDAKKVEEKDAAGYILGYTVINDVSAREIQTRHKQWYFGKGLDGFTPMGPWIVTADEISFPPKLGIQSRVNGELRQDSNTELLIFDIPHIIHELSQGITLKAGTIIATGTPAGVGMGFDPPKFLKAGDEIACTIEGIGTIKNVVK
ncbi:fumarylacetoacetate hydrolase family protein [Qiania dongpingensis]|uniref:Fumarylacetoacetate hydrolase family protein n=1 Tax=Qiania dongpingensis TaxID=2763669 RepID=A0A7G9G321_9FIRM|nr:fumarylacetoacetate hydrolase family protein [Qiania dongpingensis]QNM05203.1 fumarylacetoacetate hydrolase family protein [Qiania dongpingensis]